MYHIIVQKLPGTIQNTKIINIAANIFTIHSIHKLVFLIDKIYLFNSKFDQFKK